MNNIEEFIERWSNNSNEKSDTQKFWFELLRDILGLESPESFIEFEKRVALEHVSYIDAYIPSTRTIIEQKSFDVNLDKAIMQSDGTAITPFQQAKRYSDWLPDSERARWIITCNFHEFQIHDMERPKAEPEIIRLEDLEEEAEKFLFLIDSKAKTPKELREEKISIEAGRLVWKLRSAIEPRYLNPNNDKETKKKNERSLTILCVRIVFLLYAEDSGLLGKRQFYDYLKIRELFANCALHKLFQILNQKPEERYPYIREDLKAFPYIDGGLFADQDIDIPLLDGEPLEIILQEMSGALNWRDINPTIFGAIFERVLGGERETGGMHYTIIENIHKLIDPLFLDELNAELEKILAMPKSKTRTKNLLDFQDKLASLKFLDPACGSGNFLTESFKSLRMLENRILRELKASDYEAKIKISISQFHGIEVNPFAVAVARTALWISDNQMLSEVDDLTDEEHLPLKNYDHIKEGSAMHELEGLGWGLPGWKIHHEDMLYIMGNPPFLGYSQQNHGQKEDVKRLIGSGKVDYVACWFALASEYVQDKQTKAAFIATNSITQGEQVAKIFKPLHERWGIEIDFAYQSFAWDSEIKDNKAHVHVVIICISTTPPELRKLYTPEGLKLVDNINFYLNPVPNVFVESRKKPLCKEAPVMKAGGKPTEGGNLILTLEERDKLLKKNPKAKKFIRPLMMGEDFIQCRPRYCLWLVNATPRDIAECPKVFERVKKVKEFRLASKKKATQRKADTPILFDEVIECSTNYLAIPKTSSENRKYIPIGWLDASTIPGDALRIIPDASLYDFGILTSRVHMAWMRSVGGRLEISYSYSNTIVYNNFVWPSPTKRQREKIENTAQKILDVRAMYPNSSFADMYNDVLMPNDLRKAHLENDAAVCEAYGWPKNITDNEIVAKLFVIYKELTE